MIVCAGEALIDMLPRRTEAGEDAFAPHVGGAVLNTAVALGRLGAPVGFLSGLSTDLFGERIEAALTASGVDASLCVRSARPTTLAFVTLEGGQASYAFYDEGTALRTLTPDDLPALPEAATAVFLGGISLVLEPAAAAFEALARREAGRRAVVIDPNIRPGFVADGPAYRARLDRLLALADIVKVSDEDLRWIMGEGEAPALAARMLSRGPSVVAVTAGAEGAQAFTADGSLSVPAERVEVVDTVGAGDTFDAGLLTGLHASGHLAPGLPGLTEEPLRDALRLGARAAAVTVSRAGANPPWRGEL
jgi:fructokinase